MLGAAHVAQSDDVRVFGVQLSSDLSLDKHVNVVSAKCFFQLRQLRRIRRSFDDDSVATLVHAFITSRFDRLLQQSPEWRSEEDDQQVGTCSPQHGSTNRLEHAQVRPGTHSFPATGFGSESASRCSDVCTRWLLNTCRPTANPPTAFLVVATCDRLMVISTSHV